MKREEKLYSTNNKTDIAFVKAIEEFDNTIRVVDNILKPVFKNLFTHCRQDCVAENLSN